MSADQVTLTVRSGDKTAQVDATRVVFSPHQCFRFDGSDEERRCLDLLADHLVKQPGLALYGTGPLLAALARQRPDMIAAATLLVVDPEDTVSEAHGLPTAQPHALPETVATVFLCETMAFPRQRMRQRLPSRVAVIDPVVLGEIAGDAMPACAWTPIPKNIYPIEIPEIVLEPELDLILMDCPARNLALMPNGLAYVHNALKTSNVTYQTFDLDIIAHHRYHMNRLFDEGGKIVLANGREMPVDPWQAEHYDLWADPAVLEHFRPLIVEAAAAVIKARPKILGLSVQQCNEALSRELIQMVKAERPETIVIVGGFSCYNADIGRRGFPDCDYMCIGEADLTVGPLVEKLARGERPRNQAGVLSRFDTPDYRFLPAPMPHNLESLPFPRYDWFSLDLYRNFNGYQLVPIIASRGCRWSRCTFCAERFYWRIRPEKEFVDELEWLVDQGCHLFMFNESDLNGNPEKLLAICDEIIDRDLNIRLTGQLRIHKKSDRAFFDKLRAAGFVALRFGVDAFSENTLRLQKKGYTKAIAAQNLKDCWEAGIYTEVNWVVGVPGETEADVKEGIAFILDNQQYIGRLANINPLIVVNGGVYWIDPDSHHIVYRRPKQELYDAFPRALPADMWYSTHPYIDAAVRRQYFERIVLSLYEAGFPVGAWANRVIDDVKTGRDRNRAGRNEDLVGAVSRSLGSPGEAQATYLRSLQGYDLFAYRGRFYGVPEGRTDVDFTALEVAPPSDVAVGLTEIAAAGWVERMVGELKQPLPPVGEREKLPAPQTFDNEEVKEPADDGVPHLIRAIGTTNVVRFAGLYYAVPRALGAVDVTHPEALPNGILSAPTLAELTAELNYAERWANSRGILDSQENQRRRGSLFRADSSMGEVGATVLEAGNLILRGDGEFYSVARPALLSAGLGEMLEGSMEVAFAVSKTATPELMRTAGTYNIVSFDALYYAIPHGLEVRWGEHDIAALPGVVVSTTLNGLLATIGVTRKRRDDVVAFSTEVVDKTILSVPRLLAEQNGYNIVEYEGWIYGMPHVLGPIDLTETDVIGLSGVIRDVSRSVVEEEITERAASRQSEPAAAE
jgi:radical SAM superfamily enzyme YgiQ (UPF0313 family)